MVMTEDIKFKNEYIIKNEEDTEAFGYKLAEALESGDVVCLIGDLGTGKTTLTRYLAKGLGVKERLNSPTFTIVKEYHSGRLPLYHFDVYRVSDYDELFNIGFEEYLYGEGRHRAGVSVIEWADLILDELPEDITEKAKMIFIYYVEEDSIETEGRIYRCTF